MWFSRKKNNKQDVLLDTPSPKSPDTHGPIRYPNAPNPFDASMPHSNSNIPVRKSPGNVNNSTPDAHILDQAVLGLTDTYRPYSAPRFVGGFKPLGPSSNANVLQASNATAMNPQPRRLSFPFIPSMPIPQPNGYSLTMQEALRYETQHTASPETSPTGLSFAIDSLSANLSSVSIASPNGQRDNFKATRPNKIEHQSAPQLQTQTTSISPHQCAGITKAGKRCTRKVKPSPAHLDSDNPPVEVFCYQHTKELLLPSGYFSRKDGSWVKFEDWIPKYLQLETQVALRVEMERAKSKSDTPGYIYTFEIRDPEATDIAKLKVGRAVNLVKRIDQWGKQCGSKEQALRGWYPGTPDSLMKGRVQPGEGPRSWCHRLERLIHIELADLAATGIHLDPSWPTVNNRTAQSTLLASKATTRRNYPCPDCGSMHKEIFEFKRYKGRKEGKEWEMIVQPVIERWGTFVDLCV